MSLQLSGLQQQVQLVAAQQPVMIQVHQAEPHRILRIAVDGAVNDPQSKWSFTTANGTQTFPGCELMVMTSSVSTFKSMKELDRPLTVEMLNEVCASDFSGTQNYFFVVRVFSHYLLLQPPTFECKNVDSFEANSEIRRAARHLGQDLLWFAFKSYSGALQAGITQVYRRMVPPNLTEVHQSNKELVRRIDANGTLCPYTGIVDPQFYFVPPVVAATPVASAAAATVAPVAAERPPPQQRRQKTGLTQAQRRAMVVVADANAALKEQRLQQKRAKKAELFAGNKTATARSMMLANTMPIDLEVNSIVIKRMCGLGDPSAVTFDLSLSAAECRAYAALIPLADETEDLHIKVNFNNGDKVDIDLNPLASSVAKVKVSLPSAWVPPSIQQELINSPQGKKSIEDEMARVIRTRTEINGPFAPEFHDALAYIPDSNAPYLGATNADGVVTVVMADSLSDDGVAPIKTRNIAARRPIAAGENFLQCAESRLGQYAHVIGLQLGYMLFGVSKEQALPTNYSTWSHKGIDYIVQFGAIDETTIEDSSLIIFAGQCAKYTAPNARINVIRCVAGEEKITVCLTALVDIPVGSMINIDRGHLLTEALYPCLVGKPMPTLCNNQNITPPTPTTTTPTTVSTQSALFDILGSVASQQYVQEEAEASEVVLLRSAPAVPSSNTVVVGNNDNNLNDDDDNDDNHENVEASMRNIDELARLRTLDIIRGDLQQPTMLQKPSASKRRRVDEDSNDDFTKPQLSKMPLFNFKSPNTYKSIDTSTASISHSQKKNKVIRRANQHESLLARIGESSTGF